VSTIPPSLQPSAPLSARSSGRPSRQGEARRDEIILQAIAVFGESGFAGGRIDDVADRVGIRRPSILYHFPDKSVLYAAAVSEVVVVLADRFERAPFNPQERLDAIADAWVDFVIDRPNAARLLLRQLIDSNPVTIRGAEAPTRRLIALIADGIDQQGGPKAAKALDAGEFSLVLASLSLVWVASQSAVEGVLGINTLSPASIQRHRRTLHLLIRQMIAASQDAQESDPDPDAGRRSNSDHR
jgi:TetR/AcrR family transcriptional regulator